MRSLSLSSGFALIAAAACSGSGGTDPVEPGSVTITAPLSALVPGETVQLAWQVKDAAGMVQPGATVTFSSSSPAVASVSTGGLVTAASAGSSTITAQSGEASGSVMIVVNEGGLVTTAGGTVSGYGGAIELTIPAGALAAPTAIRLETASNPLLDPTAVGGSVYSISPSDLAFTVPAIVRVRYSPADRPVGLPETNLRVRVFQGNGWTGLPDGSADVANARAAGSLLTGGTVSVGWVAPAAACTSAESRQFDFWVGSWNVSENGQPAGLSDITLVPGGCAVLEHFRSSGVGRSISFYEPTTDKWYQTYIDDAGNRLLLAGRFLNGNMDLIHPPAGGSSFARTRWSAVGNNVRQEVDALSRDGGVTFAPPVYDLLYTRR